jgi:hypothetical protein
MAARSRRPARAWPLVFAAAALLAVLPRLPNAAAAAAGSGSTSAAAKAGVPAELARLGLPDDFFSEYFGKTWVHLPAGSSSSSSSSTTAASSGSGGSSQLERRFQDLWGRRQAARASSEAKFRAVSSGVEHPWVHIPGNRGGDRVADARVAWRLNMTLVHDGAEERHAPLAAFLFHVCAFFGLYVRANSYMTPPGHVQGFEFHTGEHM